MKLMCQLIWTRHYIGYRKLSFSSGVFASEFLENHEEMIPHKW